MRNKIFIEIICLSFIILFLYSGISKVLDYYVFVEQLALFPLLAPMRNYIAVLLPSIEIVTSILLFFPKFRFFALYTSLVMMVAFTVFVVIILNYNTELPCTCGGLLQQLSWRQHLIFNTALVVLATIGVFMLHKLKKYERKEARTKFSIA